MTPELKARVSIDAVRVAADWHVRNDANANVHASAGGDLHLSITPEVDANLQRAQSLLRANWRAISV